MIIFLCVCAIVPLFSSVTHWVLQDNVIYTKERSEYDLRDYDKLNKVLEQDSLVKDADNILDQLDVVKQKILSDAPLLNSDNIGEKDCLEAGLLSDFDFSILPAIEKTVDGYSKFEQYMCESSAPKNIPNCTSVTPPTFSMGDYSHIPGVSYIKEENGTPSYTLLSFLPTDDIALFGHCLHQHMIQNPENWHVYFAATFYWRLQGNDVAAAQCTLKSLHYTANNIDLTDGPLVTLANLLSSAGFDSDAALVMEHSATTPYLQQLKLWSAGNLYTLSEQYKLSLDLYNKTLELGPFPLADERLKTMECYSDVIRRMEKQSNVLRATLQKLQERHELETQYIGIQERMFSNLYNFTLPDHIILQIQNTEDAVTNTHKLVQEQQEIQDTLSPNKFTFPVDYTDQMREEEMTEEEKQLEREERENEKMKPLNKDTEKKDINWIKSTRLKLEDLISHIKLQLSDEQTIPVSYFYLEDGEEEQPREESNSGNSGYEGEFFLEDEEQEPRETNHVFSDDVVSIQAEVIPPVTTEDLTPAVESIAPNLSVEQNVEKNGEKNPALSQDKHFKCKMAVNNDVVPNKIKLDKPADKNAENRVRILIKEETDTSVTFELFDDGEKEKWEDMKDSKELIENQLSGLFAGKKVHVKIDPTEQEDTELNVLELIRRNIQSTDLIQSLIQTRLKRVKHDTLYGEEAIPKMRLMPDDEYTLRWRKVVRDAKSAKVVKVERCSAHESVFTYQAPYIPLMLPVSSFGLGLKLQLLFQNLPNDLLPSSPDCTAHMHLDSCEICYDNLYSVNSSLEDERVVTEPFALLELDIPVLSQDILLLGAIIDYKLKQDAGNWMLYHLAALYHRTTATTIGPSIQCTRRALALVPYTYRTIPLLTLTNILHQAERYPDAMTVLLELLQLRPKQYHSHLQSALLHEAIGDSNGGFYHVLEALRLNPASPAAGHLFNSMMCYHEIDKEVDKPPFKTFVKSKAILHVRRDPPYPAVSGPSQDGEVWEVEHVAGGAVNVTWVSDTPN